MSEELQLQLLNIRQDVNLKTRVVPSPRVASLSRLTGRVPDEDVDLSSLAAADRRRPGG